MDQREVIFPDASHVNGTSEGGTTESVGVTAADPTASQAPAGVAAGLRPGFLAELAVAMRATAEKERERIGSKVADDAAAHVEKVRARAAIETDELKRLAEEDVQHIEAWSTAEMERIRGEADTKIEDRRASLEEYLKQHDTIIDTEIDGVNAAVQDYNATLDRYFEELAASSDPASIVARAEALPAPPDLDALVGLGMRTERDAALSHRRGHPPDRPVHAIDVDHKGRRVDRRTGVGDDQLRHRLLERALDAHLLRARAWAGQGNGQNVDTLVSNITGPAAGEGADVASLLYLYGGFAYEAAAGAANGDAAGQFNAKAAEQYSRAWDGLKDRPQGSPGRAAARADDRAAGPGRPGAAAGRRSPGRSGAGHCGVHARGSRRRHLAAGRRAARRDRRVSAGGEVTE